MQGYADEVRYPDQSSLSNNMTQYMTSSHMSLQSFSYWCMSKCLKFERLQIGLLHCFSHKQSASLTCNGLELTIKGKERCWDVPFVAVAPA